MSVSIIILIKLDFRYPNKPIFIISQIKNENTEIGRTELKNWLPNKNGNKQRNGRLCKLSSLGSSMTSNALVHWMHNE